MANLNLGQDVANKRENVSIASPIVAKFHALYVASCKNLVVVDLLLPLTPLVTATTFEHLTTSLPIEV